MHSLFRKINLVSCLVLLICCSNSINKKKIAMFDSDTVSFSEALDELDKLSNDKKVKLLDYDECYRFVRKLALEKIILDRASKEELDKDKTIIDSLEKAKKNTAFEILKKKNVINKIVINKDDYRDYRKKYEIYQIVKRTDILDESRINESRKLLEKLSKEIKDLESFKENAKKYSDDVTASHNGYVGNIRLGIMEEPIDNAIKKMKVGVVSDVVESSNALHLLFIKSVEEVPEDELYSDRDIYELIYREKQTKLEEEWYEKLLKYNSLKLDKEAVDKRVYDDKIIIQYKNKSITRKEFFETVDRYKQNNFPEPTKDELVRLMNNLGLGLILEDESLDPEILKSRDFKDKIEREKKFLLLNRYIDTHIVIPEVTDESVEEFYKKNLKTLFTFRLESGKYYQQPIGEVKKFITQKIETQNTQNARYDLYRKLVEEENLKIEKELVEELMKRIGY